VGAKPLIEPTRDPKRNMRGGKQPSQRARDLRNNATDPERALWQLLRNRQLGRRFRRQFVIAPYIVDFACPEARLIVEADGGQHAEPDADASRNVFLRQKGWRILRFWNNDILQNREGVAQRIVEALHFGARQVEPP
jgi:very-short-patch-repair endonuclease